MHNSIAYKFCIFKSCDKRKYSFLLTKFKVCLKAHKVIQTSLCVLCTKLNDGIRSVACSCGSSGLRVSMVRKRIVSSPLLARDLNPACNPPPLKPRPLKSAPYQNHGHSQIHIDKFIIEPEIFFLIHRAVI